MAMLEVKKTVARLLSGMCLSLSALTCVILSPSVNPLLVVAGRCTIQSSLIFPLCIWRRQSLDVVPEERLPVVLHLCFGAATITCFYYSFRFLPLTEATALVVSGPILAQALSMLYLNRHHVRMFRPHLIRVLLTSAGVVLVAWTGFDSTTSGVVLALIGAFTHAILTVIPLRLTPLLASFQILSLFTCVICTLLFTFVQDMRLPSCGLPGIYFVAGGVVATVGITLHLLDFSTEEGSTVVDEEDTVIWRPSSDPEQILSQIVTAFVLQMALRPNDSSWMGICGTALVALTCLLRAPYCRWIRSYLDHHPT